MSKGKDDSTWCCIPYELTEAQRLIAESKKIIRMASTGRRFGKAFLAGHVLVDYARNNPGSVSWYIMPTYGMGKSFRYWADKRVSKHLCLGFDLDEGIIKFKNGAAIWSNIFKYVWRCGDKEGKMVEDMQKVLEYAAKFIEVADGTSAKRVSP